jgi:sortase B
MTQKIYIIEGREFRTAIDYHRALKDKQLIETLRSKINFKDRKQLEKLSTFLSQNSTRFQTMLGQDFAEEVERTLAKLPAGRTQTAKKSKKAHNLRSQIQPQQMTIKGKEGNLSGQAAPVNIDNDSLDPIIQKELKKRERIRRIFLSSCGVVAACCLGYFGIYSFYHYRTKQANDALSQLREQSITTAPVAAAPQDPVYTLTTKEVPDILPEYKILYSTNKKLIGWLKIDDTYIDYPVMQTGDNEYYLDHNMNQEYDKNGSIFMDTACDVLKPSTNLIVYGHNMKSGQMFGNLDKYSSEKYYQEHPTISFDTIYEKGTYEIMYVFRSHIYSEEEITFKYYQFIDVLSEQEFDSNMTAMAAMSLYDTGVTAKFGDRLLTLSTCDYREDDGRFVVVAKKI